MNIPLYNVYGQSMASTGSEVCAPYNNVSVTPRTTVDYFSYNSINAPPGPTYENINAVQAQKNYFPYNNVTVTTMTRDYLQYTNISAPPEMQQDMPVYNNISTGAENIAYYSDYNSDTPYNYDVLETRNDSPFSNSSETDYTPYDNFDSKCVLYNEKEDYVYTYDKLIINSWSASTLISPKKSLTLHHVKAILQQCIIISDILKIESKLTEQSASMDENMWRMKINKMKLLTKQYNSLISELRDPNIMSYVKRLVDKTRKKRINRKNRKIRIVAEKQEELLQSKIREKEIDHWLAGMKEKANKIKEKEKKKRDADCILKEVIKKKLEARKQLCLITALIKLRNVRTNKAQQEGTKLTLEDKQGFNITTEKLIKIWGNLLKRYSTEEQNLRTMLEKTALEDSKRALMKKHKQHYEEWKIALFGNTKVEQEDQFLYWSLMAAECNMQTFIAIRRSWDTFLVDENSNDGSKIPIGWVVPDEEPNVLWAKFLNK
ncbi:programmed cell death protein 7-like [Aethina tumida]|uniref:programmed cell death protein 7-like n=1 Tax=Aethina tumida TaxID=116153 RepID=UPI0021497FA9|nr:programmed cell death protein 7-like [Aethina tumida]